MCLRAQKLEEEELLDEYECMLGELDSENLLQARTCARSRDATRLVIHLFSTHRQVFGSKEEFDAGAAGYSWDSIVAFCECVEILKGTMLQASQSVR